MTTHKTLREANVARQIEYGIEQVPVPLSFRALEWLGEVGELAEVALDPKTTIGRFREEAGDVFITTDLLLIDLNIDDIDVLSSPRLEGVRDSNSVITSMLKHATVVGNQVKKAERTKMGFRGTAADYSLLRENLGYFITDVYSLLKTCHWFEADALLMVVEKFNSHSEKHGFQTRFDPAYEPEARMAVESTPAAPGDTFAEAFPVGAWPTPRGKMGFGGLFIDPAKVPNDPHFADLGKTYRLGAELPKDWFKHLFGEQTEMSNQRVVGEDENMDDVVRQTLDDLEAAGFQVERIEVIDTKGVGGGSRFLTPEEVRAGNFSFETAAKAPDTATAKPKLDVPYIPPFLKTLADELGIKLSDIGLPDAEGQAEITPPVDSPEWVNFANQLADTMRLTDRDDLADEVEDAIYEYGDEPDPVVPTVNFPAILMAMMQHDAEVMRGQMNTIIETEGKVIRMLSTILKWVAERLGPQAAMELSQHLLTSK